MSEGDLSQFSPNWQQPTPTIETDVMMRTFEEINAALAEITGVSRTNSTINNDSSLGDSSDGTFTQVIQSLPSSANVKSFVPANQMGITQLAISYCDQLVDSGSASSFFGGLSLSGNVTLGGAGAQANRDKIINNLLSRTLNVELNGDGSLNTSTQLATMPDATTAHDDLNILIDGGTSTIDGVSATVTGLAAGCSSGVCDNATAKKIIKATCAAAVASSPVLLK